MPHSNRLRHRNARYITLLPVSKSEVCAQYSKSFGGLFHIYTKLYDPNLNENGCGDKNRDINAYLKLS